MSVTVKGTSLPGVIVIEPRVYHDHRGFFLETYHLQKYTAAGITSVFVQDNLSHSRAQTVRGLHYQLRRPQAKLITVLQGEIFDVAVDIRRGSPTFGRWVGVRLSAATRQQIFIPEGFAHGFCVLSETADVLYKCSDFYDPTDEYGILWSDPTLAIEWPVTTPILSAKDSKYPTLAEIPADHLPTFTPVVASVDSPTGE
ncbi:MAG TPA: dTDP-4-dehydrorhamnose 3,5-epimerase [Blastocatellia bacterium]|nr:dTDP-4-dehydrorhamnose 3,5-epimerase [Blastocatellia bacterium]